MTEELNTIQTVDNSPFKHLIMTIGELPTSFIDSMSYYEMLAWLCNYIENTVIPAVNNNADALQELQDKFVELKNYVDHYFDNLDVTDEINNKLDNMAEDGTLTNLIKAYVDPIYQNYKTQIDGAVDEQNNRIDQIDDKVDAVANGSPAGVYATAEALATADPDHDRVYLVTADGKWYYYDTTNSQWTIGGTYQSTGLADNIVRFNNLDKYLQENMRAVYQTTDIDDFSAGYYKTDGTTTTWSNTTKEARHYEFSVEAFELYHIVLYESSGVWNANSIMVQFVDSNNDVISNIKYSEITLDENYCLDEVILIPSGCTKLRLNFVAKLNDYTQITYINKIKSYEIKNIHKNQLDDKLQSIYENVYTEVTPEVFISGYYIQSNTQAIPSNANGQILELDVTEGDEYIITIKQFYGNPILMFATSNMYLPKTIGAATYNVYNIVSKVQGEYNEQFENYTFTIPPYCTKLYINSYIDDSSFEIKKCTSYKVKASTIIDDYSKNGFSKIWAIGDSITKANYYAATNYLDYIKTDMPDLTIENLGENASGYKQTHNTTFIQRISQIDSYSLANDIVTVMGSVNDVMYAWNLGHLGDTTTDTLYGSMYQFFTTLFTTYPACRVGAISPLPWKFSEGEQDKLDLYVQALKETCEMFNVPFLDIHNASNLRPNNNTFLSECYTSDGAGHAPTLDSDGIHPNSKGHRLFYERIKSFINTL